jgi:hypothetical protein
LAQDGGALVQRFAHQAHIALCQVTHAAMRQLGGARRGALGEVMAFHQHHAQASGCRVQRHPQAGGAAADDGQVPFTGFLQA